MYFQVSIEKNLYKRETDNSLCRLKLQFVLISCVLYMCFIVLVLFLACHVLVLYAREHMEQERTMGLLPLL